MKALSILLVTKKVILLNHYALFYLKEWVYKYFENFGKNMSFLIKDNEMWDKYDKILNMIKNKLGIKFHS